MRGIYSTLTALVFSIASLPLYSSEPGPGKAVAQNQGPNTFSFSDIPPIQTAGTLSAPGWGEISWAPGTPPDRLFTVGMFQNSFGFQNLSLSQIRAITGQPVTDAPLSQFPLVQRMSVAQLEAAVPGLGQLPVSSSRPIQALAQRQGINTNAGTAPIEQVAPLIQGDLNQLGGDLENYAISEVPGLPDLSLSELPDWAQAQIAEVPGLSNTPLIAPLSLMDYFVPFDIPFGMSPCRGSQDCREFDIDNTASGNWENMSIPCEGGPCSHIEVNRWGNNSQKIRWITKEQKVSGGNGFLCQEEPTGRFPFGKNPKVVAEEVREAPGEVKFALYFSVDGPFGAESAHCFGPFPMPFWGERKEGQLILFGPDLPTETSPWSIGSNPAASQAGASGSGGGPPPPPVDCKGTPSTYIRPSQGDVTSEFGWRIHPLTGARRMHAGTDIAAGYGAPIYASNCGTVSYAGWAAGYGNYTCISHGKGVETCYGHQSQILVQGGQGVKRGQVIGKEGSTGGSTGPHLHFEYRIHGSPQNPRYYVPI